MMRLAVMLAAIGAVLPAPSLAEIAPAVSATVIQAPPARPARVALPSGAVQVQAITYGQPAGYRPLTLDLYLPATSTPRPMAGFPLVIYIHGGAWLGGDPRKSGAIVDFPDVLGSLAARGYVVASISYRLSGEARFPAQAVDVRNAIRWLKGHATDYGIDPSKAVVWGVSAGGHLAALAATACRATEFDPAPSAIVPGGPPPQAAAPLNVSPCVQGAVSWYGVFDLATIARQASDAGLTGALPHDQPDAAEWQLLSCTPATCKAGKIALASPVAHVARDTPPMLLIAGTEDRVVPHAQSVEMAAALSKAGVANRLIIIPGVDHSFIGVTQDTTRKATLDGLAATFAFIDATIGSVKR